MKTITVKYGPDSITKQVEDNFTISDLKDDDSIRAALGFGDNVNALVNGVAQNDAVRIPGDMSVTVETACNQKAV